MRTQKAWAERNTQPNCNAIGLAQPDAKPGRVLGRTEDHFDSEAYCKVS